MQALYVYRDDIERLAEGGLHLPDASSAIVAFEGIAMICILAGFFVRIFSVLYFVSYSLHGYLNGLSLQPERFSEPLLLTTLILVLLYEGAGKFSKDLTLWQRHHGKPYH